MPSPPPKMQIPPTLAQNSLQMAIEPPCNAPFHIKTRFCLVRDCRPALAIFNKYLFRSSSIFRAPLIIPGD